MNRKIVIASLLVLTHVVSVGVGLYFRDPRVSGSREEAYAVVDTLIDQWLGEYSRSSLQAFSLLPRELPDARRGFVPDRVWQLAIHIDSTYGVPAAVSVAQFCLESNFGLNDIGGARNYFGHKCGVARRYSGVARTRCTTAMTREQVRGSLISVSSSFAVYASIDECFNVHGKFISQRFPRALALRNDPAAFARALRGYATDGEYANKLIVFIKRYKLDEYRL